MRHVVILFLLTASIFGSSQKVLEKVKSLVDSETYNQHLFLIEKNFGEHSDRFMVGDKIDIISLLQKLKSNGILKIYLGKPKWVTVSFEGIGNPIFFIKLVSDSLQEIGYFNYRVVEVEKNIDGVVWKIEFLSKYILDPTILYSSLSKKGVAVTDVERESPISWRYSLSITNSFLNATEIRAGKTVELNKPLYDYWLEIKDREGIIEFISNGNNWHPDISFYDENLFLIKVFKKDTKRRKLRLKVADMIKYIRVSDIYQLNNMKNGLKISYSKIKR
jgi:hypothetical protein